MTMFSLFAFLAAAAVPAAPAELALASAAATPAQASSEPVAAQASAPDKICRTRFVVGQGLHGMKTRKVCRSRAEWKAAGVDID